MLDLKAKLAAAGVVTQDQVRKVEAEQARKREAKKNRHRSGGDKPKGVVDVEALRVANRGEAYTRIRPLVAKHRLDGDPAAVPSVEAKPFGFVDAAGKLRQLLLEPDVHRAVSTGKAAISAYMSNNGLAHCVLPPGIALDLAQVFPLWLRTLAGNDAAGKIERPGDLKRDATATRSTDAPADEASSSDTTDVPDSTD